MLTGRICLAVTLAACLTAAPGLAATRPGTQEMRIGPFERDRIVSVDTAGSDRIVVAGITHGYPLYHPWVRVFRPDGQPDQTFGGGDGRVEFEDRFGEIWALVLDDGRILVVQPRDRYYHQQQPHRITRLNPDGSPDTSFGTGGSIQPDFEPYALSDVLPDREGRLIVIGATSGSTFLVRRYLADGSRDTGFGTNGQTTMQGDPDSFAAGAVTPDGGVVLTYPVDRYPTVAHLSADGTLDASFAGGGTAPMQLADPRWRDNVRVFWRNQRPVVLADGGIRIPLEFDMPDEAEFRIALVGLTAAGRPDLGYGFRGLALGPRPALPGGESPRVAIADPAGSIIVAGTLWNGDDFNFGDSPIIRRFRPDGGLDRSFGDGGLVPGVLPGGGYTVFGQSLALLGEETLVSGEYTVDGKYGFWGPTALRTINAGYDREDPSISITVRGCRAALVKIDDTSGTEAAVRVNGRVVRHTVRTRFRVRAPRGRTSVSVRATDLAENSSSARVRLPRC
jgi:uncharacterized delta-60 repeat protein